MLAVLKTGYAPKSDDIRAGVMDMVQFHSVKKVVTINAVFLLRILLVKKGTQPAEILILVYNSIKMSVMG